MGVSPAATVQFGPLGLVITCFLTNVSPVPGLYWTHIPTYTGS